MANREKVDEKNLLNGKNIVVTGKLDWYTRNQYEVFIKENGGVFQKTITNSTDVLVTNTPESGTRKNIIARENGVRIVTEDHLNKMIEMTKKARIWQNL